MSSLNFSSLTRALSSLESAIEQVNNQSFWQMLSIEQRQLLKAGVIQNFEFCYELSWKMLPQKLIEDEGKEHIQSLGRKDLYRFAAQKGLIDDPLAWFVFHEARNLTPHTYDLKTAEQVYSAALQFLKPAQNLLSRLI